MSESQTPKYPAQHHITKKGYVRFRVPPNMAARDSGKLRLGHDWVWEQHHGIIPEGMQVHHKNEDKQDNRIDNLELIDPLTHKRLHGGCELRDGVWWKPCNKCGVVKEVNDNNWYKINKGKWIMPICKPCHVQEAVESKRIRRERKKEQGIHWSKRD